MKALVAAILFAAATSHPGSLSWIAGSSVDAMTDARSEFVTLMSRDEKVALQLRCVDHRLAFGVIARGQTLAPNSGRAAKMLVRADDQQAQSFTGAGKRDAIVWTEREHLHFARLLAYVVSTKSALRIRLYPLFGPYLDAEFTAPNSAEALGAIEQSCR